MESINFLYELLGKNALTITLVVILPLGFVLIYALVAILAELKTSAWIQERLGPMRTGPWGILQPVAEVIKLIQKEDITPAKADKLLYNAAPFIVFTGAYSAFAVIPFSEYFAPSRIDLGLFYIFAVGSISALGIVMGGWASNNKYSMMGAMRSVAQLISYEVPAAIAILSIVVLTSTMNLQEINKLQTGWFWNWFLFGGPGTLAKWWIVPFTIILCMIYFIAALAETNRLPFDIPEGESELVAGFHTEYSGIKFAMFFFAEYAYMFVVAAILTTVFLGGWNSPFGNLMQGPGWGVFWFIFKGFSVVMVQIWIRWTLPRFRVDQLMYLGWKILLPISFVCFLIISLYVMLK
ncbi:NADH-quinone oxidoreductase subunit NuoH [Sunxiuqinia dokdonensis]|uniref:NADH-quinone oxidoreductase subunit H n=1 Tax=Sunxiuqinia dokdonensis TaxID=1409788 RepID=A0A0L8V906_9BACT|nr:NADH-quinone oxidoreductase subunit NuoH [Sunxiuqinia dokdonensis]KOH44838.1 NADH dehydrogenase (quinone) [Sunxiuqinia dokdonensis]